MSCTSALQGLRNFLNRKQLSAEKACVEHSRNEADRRLLRVVCHFLYLTKQNLVSTPVYLPRINDERIRDGGIVVRTVASE